MTSVGFCTRQTATSVQAGISRIRDTDWEDKDLNPFRGGFVPDDCLQPLHRKTHDVPADSVGARLLQLGAPALREIAGLPIQSKSYLPVIVGISSNEQLPLGSDELFLDNLMRQAQIRIDLAASEVVVSTRAAGLVAVDNACRRLEQGFPGPIIAGGIDSYFDLARLVDLDFAERILNESNLDGFLPGEGAGLVLIANADYAAKEGLGGARIAALATTRHHDGTSNGSTFGDGLSETIDKLLSGIPDEYLPCRRVYTNLNGESQGAKEWGVCYLRNRSRFSEDYELLHPAEFMGDSGAAMGPIEIGLAFDGITNGYAADSSLIWASSDEGEYSALYVVPM